jgi:prepilin-type N-terminal cleavage/methylation domain-containing protein
MSRGFTLTELLVTVVVMAMLGTALARIIIGNTRFVSQQDAMLEAREAARAAMNTMSTEFRMVSDAGLLMARPDSVRARVPYAFGMSCGTSGGTTVVSLMPTDSAGYAAAVVGGLAWRNAAGVYAFVNNVTVAPSTNTAECTPDSIRVVPGGRLVGVRNFGGQPRPPAGNLAYLYQTVTYHYRASVDLPGRIGLWRRVGSAANEELVAPFDTSAGFGFLLGPNLVPSDTPPGNLNNVRGLELRMVGASEFVPQGKSVPAIFDLHTRIAFLNKS